MIALETIRAIFVAAAMAHTPNAATADAAAGAPDGWRALAYAEIADQAHAADWGHGWDLASRLSLAFTVPLFETGGRARFQLRREAGRWNDNGTSACLYQINRGAALVPFPEWRVSVEEWRTLTGPDFAAVRRCVAAGVRLLSYHRDRCRVVKAGGDGAHEILTVYRTGGACGVRDERDASRAAFFSRFANGIRAKLDALPPID